MHPNVNIFQQIYTIMSEFPHVIPVTPTRDHDGAPTAT